MANINWNRNTRKPAQLPSGNPKERNTSPKQAIKEHATHQAEIRKLGTMYQLYCVECKCRIMGITQEQYTAYLENENK